MLLHQYSLPSRKVFERDRLETHGKSPRIKRLRAAFTYGSLRAPLRFHPVSAKRNRLKWETGNARDASTYSTWSALHSASISRDCETTHFSRDRSYYYARASMLTKSQYRWPTWMTMDADRKLVSQPSVDSENNERVTSERVGSSCFWCL